MPRIFSRVALPSAALRRCVRRLTLSAAALSLALIAAPGYTQSRPAPPASKRGVQSRLQQGTQPPAVGTDQGALPLTHANILTQHVDNTRSGVNPNETILTTSSILGPGGVLAPGAQPAISKLYTRTVDGAIYAQPLFVSDLTIRNTFHKGVVFVATANNSIYAFDADDYQGQNAGPLWYLNFNSPLNGINPVPGNDIIDQNESPQGDIQPVIGIIGTPVIEASTATMYVLVRTKDDNNQFNPYFMQLHAIDITKGIEKINSPIDVGSGLFAPGTGSGTDGNGNVFFDTLYENQRPALALYPNTPNSPTNTLYIAFCSHDYVEPYHGWLLAFDTQTLIQTGVFVTTPNASFGLGPLDTTVGGGIDMAGAGPTIDADGNVFVASGLGLFDLNSATPNADYGESILKIGQPPIGAIGAATPPVLPVTDYFTPYNYADLVASSTDLGTGGLLLLPDSTIPNHKHLLVAGGMEGKLYVLDRDNLGQWDSNPDAVIDENIVYSRRNSIGTHYGSPAYFNGFLFYHGAGDVLRAFQYNPNIQVVTIPPTLPENGGGPVLQEAGAGPGVVPPGADFPGAIPVISSNGTSNPILWEVEPVLQANSSTPTAVLRAYDISGLAQQPVSFTPNVANLPVIYDSTTAGSRDLAGTYVKFTEPTVANGKVFVPCDGQLAVYGLTTPTAPVGNHYMIAGPGLLQAADPNGNSIAVGLLGFFQVGPALIADRRYDFSITAVDGNGNPVKLTTKLTITLSGTPIGSLKFSKQSYGTFSTHFNAGTYNLGVSDGQVTDTLPIIVYSQSPQGFDHYAINAPLAAKDGAIVALSVTGQTVTGKPSLLPIDAVAVYDTLPNGTQPISGGVGALPSDPGTLFDIPRLEPPNFPNSSTGFAYEFQWGFGDYTVFGNGLDTGKYSPFTIFGGSRVQIPIQLHGVGKHVIILVGSSSPVAPKQTTLQTGFGVTATVVINVTP